MKALATALVLCTAIVCACQYGMPFLNRQRELALDERRQAAAERNVSLTLLLAMPAAADTPPTGLRAAPSEAHSF